MNTSSPWSQAFQIFQLLLGAGGVVLLLVIAVLLVALAVILLRRGRKEGKAAKITVTRLNDRVEEHKETLFSAMLSRKELKARHKELARAEKEKEKEREKESERERTKKLQGQQGEAPAGTPGPGKPRVFVLDFAGDVLASQVEALREQVSAVLEVAVVGDEVVVRLESPGGVVHSYGLAASQLERIRSRGIELTVCVDRVAASGGYMMACIGTRILSAPFAILGSIGVVASMPNFNRVLRRHEVDYLELTAGEYKRTLTPLGEVTEKKVEKFLGQLDDIHALFKDFVARHRPGLDIARVATGEYWFGTRALELGLVDTISTSDDYIRGRCDACEVYLVDSTEKETLAGRLRKFILAFAAKGVSSPDILSLH